MSKIKTLAEMEKEDSEGFRNPAVSDSEFEAIRKATREKAEAEMRTCPIDESVEDEDEDDIYGVDE